MSDDSLLESGFWEWLNGLTRTRTPAPGVVEKQTIEVDGNDLIVSTVFTFEEPIPFIRFRLASKGQLPDTCTCGEDEGVAQGGVPLPHKTWCPKS